MDIPVHNDKDHPIYVGSSMILPGETRHFDEHDPDLPHYLRPEIAVEEAAPEFDAMVELLKLSVSAIVAEFDLLNAEEIDRLEAIENASESPRKTLLAAISEEKLRRAAMRTDAATQQSAGQDASDADKTDDANG